MKTAHDSEVPAQNQQVFTACAFIHQQIDGVTKVFMPKRAATKKFLPDVFELPGGHIDFGEHLVDGLIREVDEEFGMRIKVGEPFAVFDYTNAVKGSHSIEVIYFAQFCDDASRIAINPEDHSEYGWFAEDELDQVVNDVKGFEDDEIKAIRRGFELLRDEPLITG